jgi:hypothetical protein
VYSNQPLVYVNGATRSRSYVSTVEVLAPPVSGVTTDYKLYSSSYSTEACYKGGNRLEFVIQRF